MKWPRVLFSSTSEHFTRRRVGTVPPILVQVFARRHFQPLMATLAEICQILKSVWTEMFVCIWRHLEVKTTYIQWFYMDTNLKSKVNGKYWKHILSTVHILSLLSSCKTVAPCIGHGLTDRITEFSVELPFCSYLLSRWWPMFYHLQIRFFESLSWCGGPGKL